jgi:AcrR family transcriptional regulator
MWRRNLQIDGMRLMASDGADNTGRHLRADAWRNRERLLAAARDLFVEQGPDAPLEAIAARAGVGIATLYRRFPDRTSLMRAVVLDVLERIAEEARLAPAEEADPFAALARYMHHALDLRVSAVLPALPGRISLDDPEIAPLRDTSARRLEALIARAQEAGMLRPDVSFGDIGPLLVRLARPLPGPLPRELDDRLAHRHLDLMLDGLRAGDQSNHPLPGPAVTRAELRAFAPSADETPVPPASG